MDSACRCELPIIARPSVFRGAARPHQAEIDYFKSITVRLAEFPGARPAIVAYSCTSFVSGVAHRNRVSDTFQTIWWALMPPAVSIRDQKNLQDLARTKSKTSRVDGPRTRWRPRCLPHPVGRYWTDVNELSATPDRRSR